MLAGNGSKVFESHQRAFVGPDRFARGGNSGFVRRVNGTSTSHVRAQCSDSGEGSSGEAGAIGPVEAFGSVRECTDEQFPNQDPLQVGCEQFGIIEECDGEIGTFGPGLRSDFEGSAHGCRFGSIGIDS